MAPLFKVPGIVPLGRLINPFKATDSTLVETAPLLLVTLTGSGGPRIDVVENVPTQHPVRMIDTVLKWEMRETP